jgi:hypothetical protein
VGTEHATVVLGMDRRGFESGLLSARAHMQGFGTALSPVNRMLKVMQSSLRFIGVAGSTAIVGLAARGMLRLADDTLEARREIEKLKAAGDEASITAEMLNRAARIDSGTLASIQLLRGEWDKLKESAGQFASASTMNLLMVMGVLMESMSRWFDGEGFDPREVAAEVAAGSRLQAEEDAARIRNDAIKDEANRLRGVLRDMQRRGEMKGLSDAERMAHLDKQRLEIEQRLEHIKQNDAEVMRDKIRLEEILADQRETALRIERDTTKEKEKQAANIARAMDDQLTAEARLLAARGERGKWTLEEMANADVYTREGAQSREVARQAVLAERYGKQAILEGRPDEAEKAFAFADNARASLGALTTSESQPFLELERRAEQTNATLKALLELASPGGAGMKMQAANSDE